jgi:cytosine/adenosine deaminase-related metal-dependent hydrolase
MDQDRRVLQGGDVLVRGERIEAVGQGLAAPGDAFVVDAQGGIVLPGMIDTHRHLWQTLMRGYGADWTLTQYFVWYYLEWGKAFRPEEVFAGNLLGALEALDAGVTTTVDWSHGLQSVAHAEAALAALDEAPGRYVLAYGNIQQGPWEWATSPDVQQFLRRLLGRPGGKVVPQLAFDVPGDPAFPERAAFEVARELGIRVTTHAGVWGATNDEGIRLMHEHGFMTPGTTYVHAATLQPDSYHRIAATGGTVSVATESEESAGQGYPTTYRLRQYGIPGSLSNDTSVWWSGDLFSAMRATLGADRAMEHLEHHERGETLTHCSLRAEHVVAMATIGGARALGLDAETGSLEPGKAADVVLVRNPRSPAMLPILNPYGHLAFQAQRADVELVLAKGRVVKWAGELVDVDWARLRRLVEEGVAHLERTLGAEAWHEGMHPEIPTTRVLENPYTYTYDEQDEAGER